MALTLGVNSYATVADADLYFADYFGADKWIASTDKDKLLVTASRQLSLYVKDACKLPFTPPLFNTKLATATEELALAIVNGVVAIVTQSSTGQLKRAKAGSAEVEYFALTSAEASANKSTNKSIFPKNIMKILMDAGCIDNASVIGGVIVSGTDVNSEFCNPNPFGRTEGFY